MTGNHNAAHTALIAEALMELAKAGYTAWKNETGVWFEKKEGESADDKIKGRPHKYGKVGSADIFVILPPFGRHVEAEGKTGRGQQGPKQKLHQAHVVERNGGAYILFRNIPDLLSQLQKLREHAATLKFFLNDGGISI